MPFFRQKAEVFEAIQYDGRLNPAKKFLGIRDADYDTQTRDLILPKPEGAGETYVKHVASVGDWIIKVNGNFYAVNADTFEKRYEPVTGIDLS